MGKPGRSSQAEAAKSKLTQKIKTYSEKADAIMPNEHGNALRVAFEKAYPTLPRMSKDAYRWNMIVKFHHQELCRLLGRRLTQRLAPACQLGAGGPTPHTSDGMPGTLTRNVPCNLESGLHGAEHLQDERDKRWKA